MKTIDIHASHTHLARLSAAILVALLAVFGSVSAASAHDQLISSDPASGSTVTEAPEKIILEFSGKLQQLAGAQTSVVALSTEDGTKIASEATTKGTDVTVVPETKLSSGTYKLAYRVASSDGHPIEDSISFTVNVAEEASESANAPASNAPVDSEPADQQQQPIQELGSQVSPIIWVVLGLAILGAAIAVLMKFTRQNK
ncbi:copper resistance protein CopC [Glutamicibacter arilaitensis]|uniref:copper resistance CopC family protein n=1 Tax=Glutamicibacter arilaitensis TaxID=256701 RepID=UPI00384D947B